MYNLSSLVTNKVVRSVNINNRLKMESALTQVSQSHTHCNNSCPNFSPPLCQKRTSDNERTIARSPLTNIKVATFDQFHFPRRTKRPLSSDVQAPKSDGVRVLYLNFRVYHRHRKCSTAQLRIIQ